MFDRLGNSNIGTEAYCPWCNALLKSWDVSKENIGKVKARECWKCGFGVEIRVFERLLFEVKKAKC